MLMSADGPPRERAGVGGGGEERDPVTGEVKRRKDGDGVGGSGQRGSRENSQEEPGANPRRRASRRPRRPRCVPLPTSKPEMSGHLRASCPRSNAARIVFGEETSKCLREEGGGQTGGRGRREDSHRRRKNGETGGFQGSLD